MLIYFNRLLNVKLIFFMFYCLIMQITFVFSVWKSIAISWALKVIRYVLHLYRIFIIGILNFIHF